VLRVYHPNETGPEWRVRALIDEMDARLAFRTARAAVDGFEAGTFSLGELLSHLVYIGDLAERTLLAGADPHLESHAQELE
jgi:hypothetical protein